jgi:hypothetical protein
MDRSCQSHHRVDVATDTYASVENGLHLTASSGALFHGECSAARALAHEGLDLATVHRYPGGEARAWFILGLATEFQGDLDQAEPRYRHAVERRDVLGGSHWTSRALACLADALYMQPDPSEAGAHVRGIPR